MKNNTAVKLTLFDSFGKLGFIVDAADEVPLVVSFFYHSHNM
jgi:hypothetical protein